MYIVEAEATTPSSPAAFPTHHITVTRVIPRFYTNRSIGSHTPPNLAISLPCPPRTCGSAVPFLTACPLLHLTSSCCTLYSYDPPSAPPPRRNPSYSHRRSALYRREFNIQQKEKTRQHGAFHSPVTPTTAIRLASSPTIYDSCLMQEHLTLSSPYSKCCMHL